MSREYQERIKPINKDGTTRIKAQMRKYYRRAKMAKALGQDRLAAGSMKEYHRLKKGLEAERKSLS